MLYFKLFWQKLLQCVCFIVVDGVGGVCLEDKDIYSCFVIWSFFDMSGMVYMITQSL